MPDEPDPWADLYADLGVDAQTPPRDKPRESFLGGMPTGDIDSLPVDSESDGDDSPEGNESGEGELDEDGQPKRRRRRRRRGRGRKGEAGGEMTEGDDAPLMPAPGEPIVLEAPAAYDAEEGDFDSEEPEPAGAAFDSQAGHDSADYSVEDATPTANRSLIADWNVPSWQEIVAGLYRPER